MHDESAQRYPLSWPPAWKRTPGSQRLRGGFSKSVKDVVTARDNATGQQVQRTRRRTLYLNSGDAARRLEDQLERMGATDLVLSTNQQLRLDGMPRSNQGEPYDPGAAVYFKLKGKPRVLACDRYRRVADNVAALAAHVDALRRIDRYGVGTLEQAFAGYTALPATGVDWWIVLEVPINASREHIEAAYREKIRTAHPDVGGSDAEMSRLNVARDAAFKARP